ncbi:MAG TPA: ester cyclase [Nitrolancea sp.]|nr:ester cyclase [Nitrolancea sp.]
MTASPPTTDEQLTPEEERNLRSVTDVLHYWNTQDIQGMFQFYDDNITWTNVAMEKVYHGKAEVAEFLEMLFTAIPDLHFEVTYKFVRGNQVAERWHITGTHLGPLMGVPATGKHVDIPGIGMVQMKDGKFLSDWFLLDVASTMRQIGLMPPLTVGETPIGRAVLWAAVNRKIVGAVAGSLAALTMLRRFGRRKERGGS